MIKVQFGAGWRCKPGNDPGWINHDVEVDITKPLPYADGTVDRIFTEHCLEHVTHRQAWDFLVECRRIIKPDGRIRIAVPSVPRIWLRATPAYVQWLESRKWGDGSKGSAVKSIVFNHQHQSCWSLDMLTAFVAAAGFSHAFMCRIGESNDEHMRGLERHGEIIGHDMNAIETVVVEGMP